MDVAATSVLIFLRDDSQCWWQRRAWDDDSHPGRLDFAAGGGIEAGETPAAAAARELEEELGMADLPLQPLGRMRLDGEICELFDAPLPGALAPRPGGGGAAALAAGCLVGAAGGRAASAVGGLAWQTGAGGA
ncbi:NUDIX domain-containing protein [Chromobacterium subtsugae]|uniref:NUDIX domain-containing protein n=1 Tax=Chromobacterium subtsugae TaxID=251747 RepID=UPI00069BC741|nr:NUDIX domain-containing protein [Chromobacterium subtsugae]